MFDSLSYLFKSFYVLFVSEKIIKINSRSDIRLCLEGGRRKKIRKCKWNKAIRTLKKGKVLYLPTN